MVITGLALGASSHLVYLCALMPAEGESAIELGSRYPGGLAALVDTDGAGDLVLRGDQLDEILWPDAPPETAARARTMLRPQAMQSFREAPPRVAWRHTPSTYVVARYDRAFHRQLVDEMASRASTVTEWETATPRCSPVPTSSSTYSPASTLTSLQDRVATIRNWRRSSLAGMAPFQPDRGQSAGTRVVPSVAALIPCRVTRVIENVGGLQPDESAVGAGERVCLSAPVECAAVDRMVERDPLVPPVPIFVAAERAGHARSPASQEVEDRRLCRHRSATVAHPRGRIDLGYSACASGRAL
jgi:hypothetical protein